MCGRSSYYRPTKGTISMFHSLCIYSVQRRRGSKLKICVILPKDAVLTYRGSSSCGLYTYMDGFRHLGSDAAII